jgi:hypothetical protein
MIMQSKEENARIHCFEMTDPRTGKPCFKREFVMTIEQERELDKMVKQYNEDFKKIFNTLYPQFDERMSVIGEWLREKYKIIPSQKEFLDWMISNKYPYVITYNSGFESNYSEIGIGTLEEEDREYIQFTFPDLKETFIPKLIDDYLLEYCKEYVNKLDEKYKQLSILDQVEESKSIDNEDADDIISSTKLSHFEIALLYHYLGVKINHGSNAIKVAKKYQQGSGEELMKQVELIQGSPLMITVQKFTKRYHERIINQGLLDSCPVGKEKAENALRRIKMRK